MHLTLSLQLLQSSFYLLGLYSAATYGLKIHIARTAIKRYTETHGVPHSPEDGTRRSKDALITIRISGMILILLIVAYNYFPISSQIKQLVIDGLWLVPIFIVNYIAIKMATLVSGVGEKRIIPRSDGEVDMIRDNTGSNLNLQTGIIIFIWFWLTYAYHDGGGGRLELSINPVDGVVAGTWVVAVVSGLILAGLPVKMKGLVLATNGIVLGGIISGFLSALYEMYHPDTITMISNKIHATSTLDMIQRSTWIDSLLWFCSAAAMNSIVGVLAAIAYRFDYSESEIEPNVDNLTLTAPTFTYGVLLSSNNNVPSFRKPTFKAVVFTYVSTIITIAFLCRNAEVSEMTMTLVGISSIILCSLAMTISAAAQGKISVWWNYSESYDPEIVGEHGGMSEKRIEEKV